MLSVDEPICGLPILTVDFNNNREGISMNHQLIDPPFAKKAIVLIIAGVFAAPVVARELEEVIVTATRHAENVQDVGMSITALNAEQLDAAGIKDVSRLQYGVAGLVYSSAGKDAKMALRGANSGQTFEDNPSVIGMYVDGVYKPNASMQTRAFFDVERLEFLKGPQGTLYGRNTFAGALNLYTNKPNFDGFGGSISTSIERFSTVRTDAAVNVPVSDTFALRVAGFYENGDGYINNSAGQDLGAPDDYGIRLGALWTPTDDLEIITRLSYIDETGVSAGVFGWALACRNVNEDGFTDAKGTVKDCQNPSRGAVGGGGGGKDGDEWDISSDYTKEGDTWEKNVTVEINWDAGPVAIKSISSYTDMQNEIYFDFDYSANPVIVGGNNDYTESWTQEIVFASTGDGPLEWLQWTAGGYYSEDDTNSRFWAVNTVATEPREDCADGSVYGLAPEDGGACDGLNTLINGTAMTSTVTDVSNNFGSENPIETTAKAVFGEVQFSVMDNLRLIAGARYSETEKDGQGAGSSFSPGTGVDLRVSGEVVSIPNSAEQAFIFDDSIGTFADVDYDNTTYRGGVEYDFGDDMMFYGTYSEGFLAGAVNIFNVTEDQESEMFEIGMKSIWLDGTLQLNMALYTTEYTNLITQVQVAVGDTVRTDSVNGGEVDADGIDVELLYTPTDALTLGFNLAYLDAEYGDFGDTSPYQLNGGAPTEFENLNGKTPGWSPEVIINFTADYRFDFGDRGSLTPMLSIHYSDDYNTSTAYSQDPAHKQDSFTKTDFRLKWDSAEDKYRVAAYIENIEDEAVLSRGNANADDTVQVGYLYPRNYGVRFAMNFD
jgi:iron complex outermembrane receptor protein